MWATEIFVAQGSKARQAQATLARNTTLSGGCLVAVVKHTFKYEMDFGELVAKLVYIISGMLEN